jgi:hypothetical protein
MSIATTVQRVDPLKDHDDPRSRRRTVSLPATVVISKRNSQAAPTRVPTRPGSFYARTQAESEFEKYRIVQDRVLDSDLDRVAAETNRLGEGAAKATSRKGKKP